MSGFYGKLLLGEYDKTEHANLSIQSIGAYLSSGEGAVKVEILDGKEKGVLCKVRLLKCKGKGCDRVIYFGPVGEYKETRNG